MKFLKIIGFIGFVLGVLLLIGWFVFVPSAKEESYQLIAVWGEKGRAPGQFNDPTGITVTKNEVFVADARNNRIQVFDFEGNFKRQFGSEGEGIGQLLRPMGITVYGDKLYVAEFWNNRIQVFKLDGTPLKIVVLNNSPLNFPGGIAVTSRETLLIADTYNHRIVEINPEGKLIMQIGNIGKSGIGSGEFNYPTAVAVDTEGNIYVADGYNDRIQVFNSSGSFLRKWGGPFGIDISGPFNGWFKVTSAIALDKEGNVYATDFYNNRVQKFSNQGVFLTKFGNEPPQSKQLNHPLKVAVTDNGTVFVTDYLNNRITKWKQKRMRKHE